MRRRLPPPFNIRRMFRDPQGLITRLELAFAVEPVHKLKPVVSMRGAGAPAAKRTSDPGSDLAARDVPSTDPESAT